MQQVSQVGRCGYVAIVGRPNVGKSTLLNYILGQKISITSRKPQTTRQKILGIKTENNFQAIYVDTPGIHKLPGSGKAINKYMNRQASSSLADVDVIIFLIDQFQWREEDDMVLSSLKNCHKPVILAVNKVDCIEKKETLMPWLDKLSRRMNFAHIVPLSALTGHNIVRLEKLVYDFLPSNTHYYFDSEQITDRSTSFLTAEIIREKIVRQMGDELPYQVAVEIEKFAIEDDLITISALIWVERSGQKKMIIGDAGKRIKRIGQEARIDLQRLLNQHVMLNLWVKVKSGWSDDSRALVNLGYD